MAQQTYSKNSENETTLSSLARGHKQEQLARNYLEDKGLIHIISNYRCKCGEIDIIMEEKETLIFVEVRYRKHIDYGNGADTVIRRKQNKIIRTAKHYLQKNNLTDKKYCRFDVIAIDDATNKHNLLWIKDAFWVYF